MDTTVVPIFKTMPSEVDKLIMKLKEKLVEAGRSDLVDKSNVELIITVQNILMDVISSTTSDVIISPFVAEQTLLTDALIMSSMIERNVLQSQLDEFERHMSSGNKSEALKAVSYYIKLKEICLKAMILAMKKRLTHIYVNMPSKIRPSLATAMIGYDVIET